MRRALRDIIRGLEDDRLPMTPREVALRLDRPTRAQKLAKCRQLGIRVGPGLEIPDGIMLVEMREIGPEEDGGLAS